MRFLDTGDGVDDNGGVPKTVKKKYLYTTWSWPATAPTPSAFEVVFCIGTDPSATDTYIVPIQRALGTDRGLQVAIPIRTALTGVNSYVRALYA
jgi:hypothetical protein